MKQFFNFSNKTSSTLRTSLLSKTILTLLAALTFSGNIWGWNGTYTVTMKSEPTTGGYVSNSNDFSGKLTTATATGTCSASTTKSATASTKIYAQALSGYTFKGWATSASTNTVESSASPYTTTSESMNYLSRSKSKTYYAIFATMQVDKTAADLGSVNVGNTTGSSTTITITHAHAGKITAALSGTNSSDFSLSTATPVSSSVAKSTATVTVTFKPTCNGTRTATLTISSNNGLTAKTVTLTGTGTHNAQTLSWNNESDIETDMLNGTEQTISASATSGLTVSYSSSNKSVLTVDDNGKLTAKAVGSATITASQAGDCTYSAATSITKTFNVKSKDTPNFKPNGFSDNAAHDMKVGDKVTLTVEHVSAGLTDDFKPTYDANYFDVTRSDNTITIEALKACTGKTVTFTQKENSSIFGADVTYTFNISLVPNTLSVAATHSMNVDDEWTTVISNKNSDGEISATTSDATIAYYDVANKKIVARNTENQSFSSKNVTITITQAETYKYASTEKTITVTVNKIAAPITVNGSSNLSTSVYYGNTLNLTFSSPNTTSSYTVTQTSGEKYATYVENNGNPYIQAALTGGTSKWTISQAETYKYLSGSTTLTVKVQAQAEATNCYVLQRDAQESLETKISSTGGVQGSPIQLSGPGATLTFEAKKSSGLAVSGLYAEWSADGNQWNDLNQDALSLGTSFSSFSYNISDKDVKYIRFEAKVGATGTKSIRNVKVTRKTYINAENLTIDRNGDNYIFPDETGSAQLTINWSCANGGNLTMATNNEKFRLSQSTITDVDCKTGSTTLTVYYDADEAGTETAELYIANSVYSKTVTLTGICRKHDQTIAWRNGVEVMRLGAEVTEPASAILDVTYSSSNESVITVSADGKTLTAVGEGTSEITATAEGSKYYYTAEDTKTFTVSDQKAQYIIWGQSLVGLHVGDDDLTLNAYATSDEDCTTNGNRTITYESSNENVATIVDGNKLHVAGVGNAIITARQAGGKDADGHDYVATSKQNKVVVTEPAAGCVPTLNLPSTSGELFSSNTNKPQLQYDIELNPQTNGQPKSVSFACKREKFAMIWSSGNLILAQKLNDVWVDVKNCGEPTIGEYDEYTDIPLDTTATAIRFYRPQGGEGYHNIDNVVVKMARYFNINEPEHISATLGETKQTPVTVKYSGVAGYVTFSLTGRNPHFSIDKTAIETSCGSHGSELITVTYRSETAIDEDLDTLIVSDGIMTSKVQLRAQTIASTRSIHWDLPDEQNLYTLNTVNLSAVCKTPTDIEVGTVQFRLVESTTGTINGNVLSFTSDGVANVQAYVAHDDSYEDADPVTKTIIVSKTPTVLDVLPTPQYLALGHSVTTLEFQNDHTVTDIVNGEPVEGSFRGVSGDVSSIGNHTINVRFVPDNGDMYAAHDTTMTVFVVSTTFTTDGEWGTNGNWNTGKKPLDNDDVIIDADVTIASNNDIVVNDLVIMENKTVTVTDGASLTINGSTGDVTAYGNIVVEAGGQLNLGTGDVHINNFTLFSNFEAEQPKSGQVSNPSKLTTHGEAYFILDLDPSGSASYGWYSFTVPFHVDAMNGVYRLDNGNWVKAVNEVNYAIMDYHEDLRAQGKYGWKKYRSTLQPGVGYLMTVENQLNRYRFTKTENGNFNTNMTQTLTVSEGADTEKGWNSIGNGTTSYVTYASTPRYAQLYNHNTNAYDIALTTGNALVVGAAYFVQAETNNSTITMQDASDATTGLLRAPQRDTESDICFVNLSLRNNGKSNDKLFVTCDDNAAATYTIGKDVVKMGATSGISVARLWANAKNATLGAVDVAYNGNEAIIPLGIYTPVAGEYTIAIDNNPTEDVYLTRNGIIVWNLSMSDYTFDFNAGTDTSYALQVVRRINNTATGVDAIDNDKRGTDFVEKIIVNGQLFILRDGVMYDAQGKKVSNF